MPTPRRAFTLIELLVVIFIIAVTSAIIVPAFAGFLDKARFDAEIRRLQDYFAVAREKAVKGDTTVTLHFEHSLHEFSISVDALPPQNDLPTVLLSAASADMNRNQDAGRYHIGDEYHVENFAVANSLGTGADAGTDAHFHGDGTCDGADLTMVSRQGYTAHLTLSPMTGRLALDVPTGAEL